jgi:hypothetical protein
MDNAEHTHRLAIAESIASFLIGALILLFLPIPLIGGTKNLVSGEASLADYFGAIVILFGIFPFGLSLLARPLVTKVVVKSFGIEYHNTIYVLSANWKNLVNIGHLKNTTAGKGLVIVPREGQVRFRTWAKPLRRILKHDPKDMKILVSQFRPSNGHSFETDVLVNVSQQGVLSSELEPL